MLTSPFSCLSSAKLAGRGCSMSLIQWFLKWISKVNRLPNTAKILSAFSILMLLWFYRWILNSLCNNGFKTDWMQKQIWKSSSSIKLSKEICKNRTQCHLSSQFLENIDILIKILIIGIDIVIFKWVKHFKISVLLSNMININ